MQQPTEPKNKNTKYNKHIFVIYRENGEKLTNNTFQI